MTREKTVVQRTGSFNPKWAGLAKTGNMSEECLAYIRWQLVTEFNCII